MRLGPDLTPWAGAVGDFDRDGDLDLAVTEYSGQRVALLHNDGTGQFLVTSAVSVGDQPHQVIAADFNGDGAVDLATANDAESTVTILLNYLPHRVNALAPTQRGSAKYDAVPPRLPPQGDAAPNDIHTFGRSREHGTYRAPCRVRRIEPIGKRLPEGRAVSRAEPGWVRAQASVKHPPAETANPGRVTAGHSPGSGWRYRSRDRAVLSMAARRPDSSRATRWPSGVTS